MELIKYIDVLLRRKWIIITTFIFTMAVVITATRFQTPIYQASAILRIATTAGGQASYQDYMYADRLMNTFITIVTSEPVITELMDQLNMNSKPNVVAEIIVNTELIKITVEDRNPEMAAIIANNLAEILTTNNTELYSGADISTSEILEGQLVIAKEEFEKSQSDYLQLLVQTPAAPDEIALAQKSYNLYENSYMNLLTRYQDTVLREAAREKMISIAEPASAPTSPSKPQSLLNYALGLFVGIIGGVGLAFLFDNLDTTIHTSEEIETITKLSPIVEIPKDTKNQLDISKNNRSPYTMAFRKFAMKIQIMDNQHSKKVLLVMSAEPQQGKSLIVYNLAIALAETGKTVVAIDCDIYRPQLHNLFKIDNQCGLTNILQQEGEISQSLQKSKFENVTVISSGKHADDPSKLLKSPQMENLVYSLCQEYDYILLDSPAFFAFSDTEILSYYANFILFVVRCGYSKRKINQQLINHISGYKNQDINLVINQCKNQEDYSYYR